MSKNNIQISLLTISLLLPACGGSENTQQVAGEKIQEEMEQREIRRILPGEIVEVAYSRGEAMSRQAQQMALEAYRQAGSSQSLGVFMAQNFTESIDSLSRQAGVGLSWVASAAPPQKMGEKERQIWEAYLYNVENDLPLNDNVQKIGDEAFLYTRPFMADEAFLSENPSVKIASKKGFIGMWSVRIDKKLLIQSM
jgi:hypothetical protein